MVLLHDHHTVDLPLYHIRHDILTLVSTIDAPVISVIFTGDKLWLYISYAEHASSLMRRRNCKHRLSYRKTNMGMGMDWVGSARERMIIRKSEWR